MKVVIKDFSKLRDVEMFFISRVTHLMVKVKWRNGR